MEDASSSATKQTDLVPCINNEEAYSKALLLALSYANIKFVRFLALDPFNKRRCKVLLIDTLKRTSNFDYQVAFVKVVFGGLPNYGDVIQPESGLEARDTLILRPDIGSLRILPYSNKTALLLGYLHEQETLELSRYCCRGLLKTLLDNIAKQHGIAVNVGAELEFCLFDAKTNNPVDATTFAEPTLLNRFETLIADLHDQLEQQQVKVELIHAESAPGQLEIVLAYQQDALVLADSIMLAQETVREVAHQHGLKALFLPKISLAQAGNGLHFHMSIRDLATGQNVFTSDGTAISRQKFFEGDISGISGTGQSFMEGILEHLPALLAVTLPTNNSFRRVGQGCWTGHRATWAFDDKESPLRVVANNKELKWDRFEYKLCDSSANPYLALACIIGCGMDGVQKGLALRSPRNKSGEPADKPFPSSFVDSLYYLENDDVLAGIMGTALRKSYLAVRRAEESRASSLTHEDEVREALERA